RQYEPQQQYSDAAKSHDFPLLVDEKNKPTIATERWPVHSGPQSPGLTSLGELYGSYMGNIIGTSAPNSRDSSRLFAVSNHLVQFNGLCLWVAVMSSRRLYCPITEEM